MIEISSILDAERYLNNIDAVIFDLDDTLYSEKAYVRSGYRAVAALFPTVLDMEQKLWRVFECGGKAIDEVLNNEGLYTEENKSRALCAYRFQVPDISLYPGVSEMLLRIKEKSRIGLITDGRPEGQRAKIRALGLDRVMDEIIVTDELGGITFRKPNQVAYSRMRELLQVQYNRMVYVGDNASKDFFAPEQLGMMSIHFNNPDGLYYSSRSK